MAVQLWVTIKYNRGIPLTRHQLREMTIGLPEDHVSVLWYLLLKLLLEITATVLILAKSQNLSLQVLETHASETVDWMRRQCFNFDSTVKCLVEIAVLTFPLHLGPLVPRTDVATRIKHARAEVVIVKAKVVIADASQTTTIVSGCIGLSIERVGSSVRLFGLGKVSVMIPRSK